MSDAPEPTTDETPDAGPGGPDQAPLTPQDGETPLAAEQPLPAHLEDDAVPDEVKEPEVEEEADPDKPDSSVETATGEPAG